MSTDTETVTIKRSTLYALLVVFVLTGVVNMITLGVNIYNGLQEDKQVSEPVAKREHITITGCQQTAPDVASIGYVLSNRSDSTQDYAVGFEVVNDYGITVGDGMAYIYDIPAGDVVHLDAYVSLESAADNVTCSMLRVV